MACSGFPEILATQWACSGFHTAFNALIVIQRRLRALKFGTQIKVLYLNVEYSGLHSNAVMLVQENKRVGQSDENPTTEATK
jgi:hypothetical protein